MSLILEALRKSEAERRRGESPDLRTELPPVASRRAIAAPRWSRAWTVATLVLLALAMAWLAWTRPWTGAPLDRDATRHAAARDSGEAVDRLLVPAASGTVIAPDLGEARVAPPPVAPAGDGAVDTRSADGRAARPAAVAPPEDLADRRNRAAAPTPPPATDIAPVATPPSPSTTGAPLTLAELTPEQRRALPPLKVSMHMWSAEPARRFVILDGRRLAEGDRAGELVVDTIGRDDVLLAWNGMRLRLSLR